jgi:hypothetical protein
MESAARVHKRREVETGRCVKLKEMIGFDQRCSTHCPSNRQPNTAWGTVKRFQLFETCGFHLARPMAATKLWSAKNREDLFRRTSCCKLLLPELRRLVPACKRLSHAALEADDAALAFF